MDRDPRQRHFKRAARRSTIASILALDPGERTVQESLLQARFPELPGYAAASLVLLYVKAFPEELDTRPFFDHALMMGKQVTCPRVERAEHRLRLFLIRSPADDLEPGILGIPEPRAHCVEVEPDVVDWALIPGLVFDDRGYRLGRGGGHYDRLIPRMRPTSIRWALGFDCQLVDQLPVEPHDVPVDGITTPSRTIMVR